MTTLAERQQWIRDGCPVAEPPPAPPTCERFRLRVQIDNLGALDSVRIVPECIDCGNALGVSNGLLTRYMGFTNKQVWEIHGKDTKWAADDFTGLIRAHAVGGGMKRSEAEDAYTLNRARVLDWVKWVVMRSGYNPYGGHGGIKGVEGARFVYLEPDPVLSPMQPGLRAW